MLRRAVPAALACGCVVAVVALWFAANDLAAGREVDARLGDDLHDALAALNRDLLKGAQSLADTLPVAVGSIALAALAWLRGGRSLALVTALVLLVANVATQLAQPVLIDARQVDLAGTTLEGSGSWPSGHAMAAMLLALLAIVVAGPRLRAVTALLASGYALGVGAALVALGGHLPSDVIAAYLVAGGFTAAGAAAYALLPCDSQRREAGRPQATRSARSPWVAPALGALGAAAVLATGIGKALVTRRAEVAAALDQEPLLLGAAAALTVLVLAGAGAVLVLRR